MKNLKKYFNKYSATEKGLMTVLGVLIFALSFNFLSSESTWVSSVFADEGSGESSGGSDGGSEKSSDEDSEKSEDKDDEKSTDSVDEVSTPSEKKSFGSFFEKSVASVDSVDSIDSVDEISVKSEDSIESEISTEVSVKSEDELSVKSFPTIEEFDAVIELDDGFAVVVDDEKLFFLVPVEIIKTLSLDEDGNVTGVRQTVLNRILSWFSF